MIVHVGAVNIIHHLCGGWFKCPYCTRMYCACSLTYCRSCGHPLRESPELFITNIREILKITGGITNFVEITNEARDQTKVD